jgi:homoserine kinase
MMRERRTRVFAPATIANLGAGFDVLGIAIDQPGDVVIAERRAEPGLCFYVRTRHRNVPAAADQNVAAYVATLMLEEFHPPFGVKLTLEKRMPISSGLGSSAASSVASVVAVNALLPRPIHRKDLLRFAMEGERKASGSAHADNAAPSLLGGACLVRRYDPLDVISIPTKQSIVWAVVHPHISIRTEDARNILPKAITLQTAVRQWGNISGLTVGLASGDAALVGRCVEDAVAEQVRGNLIPAFHEVKETALRTGACGCSISGSGPSMFAVTSSIRVAHRVARAMKNVFAVSAGIDCDIYISRINRTGAYISWVKST